MSRGCDGLPCEYLINPLLRLTIRSVGPPQLSIQPGIGSVSVAITKNGKIFTQSLSNFDKNSPTDGLTMALGSPSPSSVTIASAKYFEYM